jgi:hypothetical protein
MHVTKSSLEDLGLQLERGSWLGNIRAFPSRRFGSVPKSQSDQHEAGTKQTETDRSEARQIRTPNEHAAGAKETETDGSEARQITLRPRRGRTKAKLNQTKVVRRRPDKAEQ